MGTSRRRSAAVAALLAGFGCLDGSGLELPWPEGSKAALVVMPDQGLYALNRADRAPVALPVGRTIALFYAADLSSLQIPAGHISDAQSQTRPLPAPTDRYEGRREGRGYRWTESERPDVMDLHSLRLPALDPEACLPDSCYARDLPDRCLQTCPTPDLPTPAKPPVIACPEAWPAQSNLRECRPAVIRPAECGALERALWDRPECEALAVCPVDPNGFAEGLPSEGPVVYVRPSAVAGQGTPQAPFGSIAEALASLPVGGAIALGPGRYEGATVTVADLDLTIVGACAERTVIAGIDGPALSVISGSFALRDLTVEATGQEAVRVEDGGLRLERVSVKGAALNGVFALRSTCEVQESRFGSAPRGVHITGGRLQVQDSSFLGASGILCDGEGEMHVERSTFTGSGGGASLQFGVAALGCRSSTVSQVRIARYPAMGIFGDPVERMHLHDVAITDVGTVGILLEDHPEVMLENQRATLSAIYIADAGNNGIVLAAAHFEGAQLFIKRVDEAGIDIESRPQAPSIAVLDGVFIEDSLEAAIEIDSDDGSDETEPTVTLRNIVVELGPNRSHPRRSGVTVTQNRFVEIHRMSVAGRPQNGVFLEGARGNLYDVRVEGSVGPALRLEPSGPIRVHRMISRDGGLAGIMVRPRAARREGLVELVDIDVVEADVGLHVVDDQPVTFERLRIGGAALGIDLEHATDVLSRGAHIIDSEDGVRYHVDFPVIPALRGLTNEARDPLIPR